MEVNVSSIPSQEFVCANQVVLKASQRSKYKFEKLQATLDLTVRSISMSVSQILVKMDPVMTSSMTISVSVRKDGLEKIVKLMLMTAWKSPAKMVVTAMIF